MKYEGDILMYTLISSCDTVKLCESVRPEYNPNYI